jgi:hypothetical protein
MRNIRQQPAARRRSAGATEEQAGKPTQSSTSIKCVVCTAIPLRTATNAMARMRELQSVLYRHAVENTRLQQPASFLDASLELGYVSSHGP